jgi:molybdate transport system permease protein
MRSKGWFRVVLVVALAVVLAFLTLPVIAIFLQTSPLNLIKSLREDSAQEALRLSFECSSMAIGIILLFGTPAAYLLARRRFRGRSTIVTLIELPLVLPPAVAGIGLLASLGPEGLLGGLVHDAGLELVLSTSGVVIALVFVAAPFYLRQAQSAFEAIAVAIPTAGAGLVSGLALAWGRALGEFGATLMFAGSFQGITQTVPLAIYTLFANDFNGALALSAVLVAVSAGLLLSIKLLTGSSWLGAGASR